MDPGFFRSRHFVVAAIVAAMFLVAGVGAVALSDRVDALVDIGGGCGPLTATGAPLTAAMTTGELRANGKVGRIETYDVPLENATPGGRVRACTDVGDIDVRPSTDGRYHLAVTIQSTSAASARATKVDARFAQEDGKLRIAVWESAVGHSGGWFGMHTGASVSISILVPPDVPTDLALETNVGQATVERVMVGNATVTTNVGDVTLTALDTNGDLTLTTDVGTITANLASVQTATIKATTNVDDVKIHLPTRADIGYDVTAKNDVGDITVKIGETESYRSDHEGPGGSVSARSKDYSSKPTHVVVDGRADVGDIEVRSG